MKRYFPFLRGKQNELMAIRELAEEIAEEGKVVPIIEPVKASSTLDISIDRYIEVSMPFVFICNPFYGEFEGRSNELYEQIISESLMEYDNWTPAFQVRRETSPNDLSAFLDRYEEYDVAVIYQGLPVNTDARNLLTNDRIENHVFIESRVPTTYVNDIAANRRVMIEDRFNRQARNADYPDRELFTDMNTLAGNPQRLDFGDFSIVGDHYTELGGPAYAVTLHHLHFQDDPGPLDISHFISDRTETAVDTPGKIIEALDKLVEAIDSTPLNPNNTETCNEYRTLGAASRSRGLGYMKKMAIKHHIEVMLSDGIQL